MAERKKSPGTSGVGVLKELGFFGGGITPFQQAAQYALSQSPESFDYSELDRKYPMRQVTPMIPMNVQQEMDEDRIAQKEALAAQRVREAQASIYESKLNEDIAAAEQVPLAREYFSKLNPQSADWPEQRDAGFAEFPLIENHPFAKSRIASMDRLYDNWAKKNLGVNNITIKDIEDANESIIKIEKLAQERDVPGLTKADQAIINIRKQTIAEGLKKFGAIGGMQSVDSTESVVSPQIPSAKEGKIYRQNGKNYRYTNGQFVELP
jgi:hypothetical protein